MKIASKISLSFLITSIVLSAVAAPLFYCYSRDALEKSAARHLLTTVESRGSHVEMFLENQKDSVLMVAETRIIKDLLEKGGSDTDLSGEALKEVNIQLAEFCVSHIDIYEAFVMDAQGEIIASSDAKHIGLDRSSDAYFLGGQEGAYVKDAYFSRTTRRPSMSVSAPVISHITGRLLGVVSFRVNMASLYEIVADRTGLGRTGEVYVINKYGYMITPSREEKDAFLKLRITLTGKKSVVLEEGEEGDYSSVNTYIDYRGIQVLGCNVGIPATKWRLIAEIDRQEVFLPMRRLRTVLLIILLSVPLAGWLAGAVVARSIVSPLRRLIDGAKEVGKGNLDHRVGTASDDEIGELSRAFDGMTGSLKNTTASISDLNKEIEKSEAAEKRAELSAKEWQDTFDSITDLISIQDKDFRILKVNKAYADAFSMKPEEIEGKICYELVHGTKEPWPTCPAKEVLVSKKAEKAEFFEPKLGIFLEVLTTPILDEKGELAGIVHVMKDISTRKKSEEAIMESVRVKSDFTSMVSHELRTPLTAIREGIGIVLDGSAGEINDEQKDFLSTSKKNVDRLTRLINDVLDFTKLEAGRMVMKREEASLKAVIEEVAKLQKAQAEGKGIYVKTDVSADVPNIAFDADRIIQVVTNLVNNAIKFTDKGGITVSASLDGDKAVVTVEDTGGGIKEEDIGKLFQEFRQLEDKNARKTGGTGLGLAISKKIVEQHGGRIWVESEFGKGTKFKFSLPLEVKRKILVVDDEVEMLRLYEKLLGDKKYELIQASSGMEAIERAKKEKPSLIVLDMRLPDINGYEVIGRLMSEREMSLTEILVVSGYEEEFAKLEGVSGGAGIPRMVKPFDAELFLKTVEGLLRKLG